MLRNGAGGVIAAGGVARDAEFGHVGKNNAPCARFSFRYGTDQTNNTALYVNCVAWHELASVASQIRRGDHVFVAGYVQEYDGSDGKHYKNIVCDYVGINHGGQVSQPAPAAPPEGFTQVPDNDDLPF